MKKWKYDSDSLKKIYKEHKPKMSYKDFKKMAEQYANHLIGEINEEIKNEKITQ